MKYQKEALQILENAPHLSDRQLAEIFIERHNPKILPDTVRRRFSELRYEAGIERPVEEKKEAKILVFDIENAPILAYVWNTKVWNTTVLPEQIKQDWYMLTWAAKWLNKEEIFTAKLTPKEAKKANDKRIVKMLWDLFDEADIVIAHNAQKFDIPMANTRFIKHGLVPPSPYRYVDTLKTAKKSFRMTYNKLDYIGGFFELGHKDHTEFDLWVKCMEGNETKLQQMLDYNVRDVILLEDVYLKLRGWTKSHPNINLYQDTDYCCSNCGSDKLTKLHGKEYVTNTQRYYAFRCNECGAISRKTTKKLMSTSR